MKIITHFFKKPVADRRFDWLAVDDETFDGSPDSRCPMGWGATEEAAIADLKEQLEEKAASAT